MRVWRSFRRLEQSFNCLHGRARSATPHDGGLYSGPRRNCNDRVFGANKSRDAGPPNGGGEPGYRSLLRWGGDAPSYLHSRLIKCGIFTSVHVRTSCVLTGTGSSPHHGSFRSLRLVRTARNPLRSCRSVVRRSKDFRTAAIVLGAEEPLRFCDEYSPFCTRYAKFMRQSIAETNISNFDRAKPLFEGTVAQGSERTQPMATF